MAFCKNCGNPLKDGAKFCGKCGAKVEEVSEEAVYKPSAVYETNVEPQKKLDLTNNKFINISEKKFFGMTGNKLIVFTLAVVSVLLLVISYFSVLNTSFEKIPVVSLILGSDADDFDDVKDELSEEIDRAEDALDDYKDELSKKEIKLVKNALNAFKKCAKNFSIQNIKKIISSAEDLAKVEVDESNIFDDFASEVLGEVTDVLDIISVVILVNMVFALIFTACGGFLKIRGLVITGMILSIIYGFIFCGFLYVLLFVAAHIALFIFQGKLKAEAAVG